jgi:DNA-binding transcriptional regulator YdaS (Cro superfamily)
MNEAHMLAAFSTAVQKAGGVRGFARLAGVQPSFVSNAIRGNVPISDTLLRAAGLERVVTYRKRPST